jgi:tRNA(Ile)-lysidine synthase
MPALAAEGLDAARLATLARRMERADQAIERAVDDAMVHARWRGHTMVLCEGYADLPQEVALRVLHRAIAQIGEEGLVELGKLEALHGALETARGRAARFRRTLAGAMITLSGEKLTVERAPPRRTAAKTGASRPKPVFTKSR